MWPVFACGQAIALPKYSLLEMCKRPLLKRYASALKHIYNFMLLSDEVVYTHLTAQLDATRGSLPTGYWVCLGFFNFSSTTKM